MKTEHTPGPWISEGSFIGIPNGKGTFYMSPLSGINQERREADARRIVACVNACAGIPTDDLEMSPRHGLLHLADFANELMKQRDDLLATLEKVTAKLAWLNSDDCGHIMALTDESEALIASIKEKS